MSFYNKSRPFKENIRDINSYLVILLGFSLPLSISVSTIILGMILLAWILEGNFINKYQIIKHNPIIYTFIAFFVLQVVGLLWTSDMKWGQHIIGKEWRILLPLILITIVKKEHIKYYIFSFLLAMSISELLSYLIFFKIVPPMLNATIYDPTPFITHVSYNPLLAFSIFLLAYLTFFKRNYTNFVEKIISVVFMITMSANMFITGGRAGQVGFFTMFVVFIFLYFRKNLTKAFFIIVITIPLLFTLAYNSSKIFHDRVDMAIKNSKNFKQDPNTSVGLRLTFLTNSLEIIKNNPIFGVGTGDFPNEYKKINHKNTPTATAPSQPHNMYILEMAQFGIFGLLSLLAIFYIQIKISLENNELKPLRLALPVLFLVIMLSDSYLLGHYTTLLFVYFSSFLYKDFDSEYI
ncbi:MAG: O-antigen ligase family protein [Sulfurospirillaceae bacterium]|nr:O-antigen ligase family protein [Sulfurospirillaceae bacterium]